MRYAATEQAEAARCRLHQPEQHSHGRRLARPVWPQKPEDMASRHLQREVVHGQDVSVSLSQHICLDDELVHVVHPFAHHVCMPTEASA